MPLFKHTFFFQQRTYGWSESFYRLAVSGGHFQEKNVAVRYCNARKEFLGFHGSIMYARIAEVDAQPTAVLPIAFNGLDAPAMRGEAENENRSDFQDTAMLIRFSNVARTRSKLLYLRGIPDITIDNAGELLMNRDFTRKMNAYVRMLRDDGFGWASKGAPVLQAVTALTDEESGQVTFTLAGNLFPELLVGKSANVRVKQLSGATELNGALTVKVLTRTTCRTVRPIAHFPWTGEGVMRWAETIIQGIDSGAIVRAVSRKAGRPSNQSRGRRSVRRGV